MKRVHFPPNGETQDFMNLSLFLPATPTTLTFPTTPIFHDDHFGKLNSVTNFFMRSLEALGRGKCLCASAETAQWGDFSNSQVKAGSGSAYPNKFESNAVEDLDGIVPPLLQSNLNSLKSQVCDVCIIALNHAILP